MEKGSLSSLGMMLVSIIVEICIAIRRDCYLAAFKISFINIYKS